MKNIFKKKEDEPQEMKVRGEPVEETKMQVVEYTQDSPAEPKNQFDRRLFCVCPSCDKQVYEHVGFHEFPVGVFMLDISCPNCNYQFQHKIVSKKGQARLQAEQMHPAAKELMRKLLKDKGGEE